MKKRRRGKIRWLSVLLTACLLLSIIPETAFAAEDTAPAKSENAAGEETQMPKQQNATEDTSNSVIENTSEDANTENKNEQTDKSNEKSSAEVATLALEQPKPDYLPQGVTYFTDGYKHAYHTQVDVTANVSVKDPTGTVVKTTQVSKSSGEFNFITEEFPSAEVLQTAVKNLQTEIETPYKARGTVTSENESEGPIIDHFESASLYTFTPTSGSPVDFSSDLEAAKQYFNEHPDATGTFTVILDVHEYQIYDYTYDLIVQEPDAVDEVITTVDIGNVWKNLDSSQPVAFTAEVNPNSECANQMTLTDEYWQQVAIDGSRIAKSNPQNPIAGETYSYAVKLTAKDGYYFHDGFKGSGVECIVICDGSTTTAYSGTLSDDRKQLTLWLYDIKVTATDGNSQDSIGDVAIEGVTFNYEPGDTPKATAYKCDPWDEQYDIEYEYWEEMETNANGESVPVKYWYSDESKNNALAQDQKITTFEDGKIYMYSLSLKARDGNTFAANSKVVVNGTNVNNANVTNTGTGLFVVAVRTIKPQTIQNISVIEINNATITFKDGDKPVFTGNVPDNEEYAFRCEWWSLDSNTGLVSTEPEWGSEIYKNKITNFEAGKTYHYGVYVTAYYGTFSPDAKLKINGQYVNYKRVGNDDNMQSMWLETDLTMTPQASGITPEYKITEGANSSWNQNSDGTLKFVANGDFSKFTGVKVDGTPVAADNYTAVSGSTVITLKKDYLRTLSVGKHTLTIVYNDGECSTEFEIKAASIASSTDNTGNNSGSTSPKVNKPDTSETTSPKTGDTNNIFLWFIILLASGCVTIAMLMVHRKKKYNR